MTRPAPLASAAFLRGYVTTMRPYLLFVSGSVGTAGVALVPGVPGGDALLLGGAFFLSYGFGQALTDCFHLDTDSLSSPYRPMVRGEIRRRDVLTVSAAGLAGVAAVLGAYDPRNLGLAALAAAGLATYTTFKRLPWAGPAYNAAIVGLVFAMGTVAGLGAVRSGLEPLPGPAAAFWPTLGVVFFGYANFVLVGYFKDVSADRRTGYRTLPVVAGLRRSARVADLLAAAEIACAGLAAAVLAPPAARWLPGPRGGGLAIAAALLLGGAGTALLAQIRLRSVRRDAEAHRAIVPVVDALLLLLLGLSGLSRPTWAPALAAIFLLYRLALRRRPAAGQI